MLSTSDSTDARSVWIWGTTVLFRASISDCAWFKPFCNPVRSRLSKSSCTACTEASNAGRVVPLRVAKSWLIKSNSCCNSVRSTPFKFWISNSACASLASNAGRVVVFNVFKEPSSWAKESSNSGRSTWLSVARSASTWAIVSFTWGRITLLRLSNSACNAGSFSLLTTSKVSLTMRISLLNFLLAVSYTHLRAHET